jgi:hypothetical protein
MFAGENLYLDIHDTIELFSEEGWLSPPDKRSYRHVAFGGTLAETSAWSRAATAH